MSLGLQLTPLSLGNWWELCFHSNTLPRWFVQLGFRGGRDWDADDGIDDVVMKVMISIVPTGTTAMTFIITKSTSSAGKCTPVCAVSPWWSHRWSRHEWQGPSSLSEPSGDAAPIKCTGKKNYLTWELVGCGRCPEILVDQLSLYLSTCSTNLVHQLFEVGPKSSTESCSVSWSWQHRSAWGTCTEKFTLEFTPFFFSK